MRMFPTIGTHVCKLGPQLVLAILRLLAVSCLVNSLACCLSSDIMDSNPTELETYTNPG